MCDMIWHFCCLIGEGGISLQCKKNQTQHSQPRSGLPSPPATRVQCEDEARVVPVVAADGERDNQLNCLP